MANSKAFLLRTFGSLTFLAKPFYTFRTSGTDAVDGHYCWLKNYMGRRMQVASVFELSGTRSKRRMNPQGRLGEEEPLSTIHSYNPKLEYIIQGM